MARVYAFEMHNYTHCQQAAPVRVDYVFPKGEVRVVPDDVARVVCGAHPQKLKLLGEFEASPGAETRDAFPAIAESAAVEPEAPEPVAAGEAPKRPAKRRR